MSATITLTFQEGSSNKFYTLLLEGTELTINFGRIGTAGQSQLKSFGSEALAQKEYDKLVAEKKKKGYAEDSAAEPPAKPVTTASDDDGEAGDVPEAPVAAKPVAKVAVKKVKEVAAGPLPSPAQSDPTVENLDLNPWRGGHLPVPLKDDTPFEGGEGFRFEGYTITFGEGDEVIISDAKGKKLKSVPDKVRKNEEYQSLMRGRKDDRNRDKRAKVVLEDRMISGAGLDAGEVSWFVDDEAFAPFLKGALVKVDDVTGILLGWDTSKGLGLLPLDYDARWVGWKSVELVHPMRLGRDEAGMGDIAAYQDLLVDVGLQQALPQAFRELKSVPTAQRDLTESTMLSGRETRSAASIERVLMDAGFNSRRGNAKRVLSIREAGQVVSVEVWFDYGEYYMPSDPTTTGSFGFVDPKTKRRLKFSAIPEVLLSEAIRAIESCCAASGAKKDADEDEEEGTDEKDEEGDD